MIWFDDPCPADPRADDPWFDDPWDVVILKEKYSEYESETKQIEWKTLKLSVYKCNGKLRK